MKTEKQIINEIEEIERYIRFLKDQKEEFTEIRLKECVMRDILIEEAKIELLEWVLEG